MAVGYVRPLAGRGGAPVNDGGRGTDERDEGRCLRNRSRRRAVRGGTGRKCRADVVDHRDRRAGRQLQLRGGRPVERQQPQHLRDPRRDRQGGTLHPGHLLQLRRHPRVRQLLRQRLPPRRRRADQERADLGQREDQPRVLGRPDQAHLARIAGRSGVQGRGPAGGPAAAGRAAEERQAGAAQHHGQRPRILGSRDRLHGRVDARLHLQRAGAGRDRRRPAGRGERPSQGGRRGARGDVGRGLLDRLSTSS